MHDKLCSYHIVSVCQTLFENDKKNVSKKTTFFIKMLKIFDECTS